MPSLYSGIPKPLLAFLPAAVNVASSTNASPISVTTSSPHGAETGDMVVVAGHETNTNANGAWQCIKTSATTLLLVGSVGNGVGGATGTLRSAAFGSQYQIPSGTDRPNAASVNVALEALGDRTAMLLYQVAYDVNVHEGGSYEFEFGSNLKFDSGSVIIASGVAFSGSIQFIPFSSITLDGTATLHLLSGAIETLDSGSFVNANGTININASGSAGLLQVCNNGICNILSGGLLDIKGDGSTSGAGDVIIRNGALLQVAAGGLIRVDGGGLTVGSGGGVDFSGANVVNLNGTSVTYSSGTGITGTKVEATANTFTGPQTQQGPTVHSGANGYVGGRVRLASAQASGTENQDPWTAECIYTGALQSGNVVWKWSNPPNGERVEVNVNIYAAKQSGNTVDIHDATGALVYSFGAPGSDQWADFRFDAGVGTWIRIRYGFFS